MALLRRLRALVLITLTWGIACGLLGALVATGFHLFGRSPYSLWVDARVGGYLFGILGMVFGLGFSLALAVVGVVRPRREVPAWWGGLVGAVMAPVAGSVLLVLNRSILFEAGTVALMAGVGAVVGAGIVGVANRGRLPSAPDRELLVDAEGRELR